MTEHIQKLEIPLMTSNRTNENPDFTHKPRAFFVKKWSRLGVQNQEFFALKNDISKLDVFGVSKIKTKGCPDFSTMLDYFSKTT